MTKTTTVSTDSVATSSAEHDTLNKVIARIDKIGDLPIFSASVNRVRMMSSSEETEVMELATEIMKDANLTTKMLRVTNSPYYNRNNIKIAAPSRAVVVLGFNTVRNITLAIKVIDSFQFEHPQINMNALLVKSYMSAGFVREVATKTGVKDPEETYTCGLLHNLGEVIAAVTIPDEYLQMSRLVAEKKCSWSEAQRAILGTTLKQIAQEVLKKWSFPNGVVASAVDYNKTTKGMLRNKQQLNTALASYGSQIMDCLYSPNTAGTADFQQLMGELQEVSGLRAEHLSNCLTTSFKLSCDLAEQYGLDKKVLKPKIVGSADDPRNRLARTLSFLATSSHGDANDTPSDADAEDAEPQASTSLDGSTEASVPLDVDSGAPVTDATTLVNILHEVTQLITQQSDINAVFSKVLEGMQRALHFDHAMLCLLTPDRLRYKVRFAVGKNAEELKKYFNNDANPKTDLFARACLNGEELLVKNANDDTWRNLIRADYLKNTGADSFVVSALRFGDKSLGFFYADMSVRKSEISPEQFRGFVQLVSQARLAIGIRNSKR